MWLGLWAVVVIPTALISFLFRRNPDETQPETMSDQPTLTGIQKSQKRGRNDWLLVLSIGAAIAAIVSFREFRDSWVPPQSDAQQPAENTSFPEKTPVHRAPTPVHRAPQLPKISTDQIEIIDLRLERTSSGSNYSRVLGEIRNEATVAMGCELLITLRDSDEKIVASEQYWPASVKNIPSGSTWPFDYQIRDNKRSVKAEMTVIDVKIWED